MIIYRLYHNIGVTISTLNQIVKHAWIGRGLLVHLLSNICKNHCAYDVILGIVLSSFDFIWPLTIYGWYNYLYIQWLLIVFERRFEILARYLSDFGALNLSRDLICKCQLWTYHWNVHFKIHVSVFWPIISHPM